MVYLVLMPYGACVFFKIYKEKKATPMAPTIIANIVNNQKSNKELDVGSGSVLLIVGLVFVGKFLAIFLDLNIGILPQLNRSYIFMWVIPLTMFFRNKDLRAFFKDMI